MQEDLRIKGRLRAFIRAVIGWEGGSAAWRLRKRKERPAWVSLIINKEGGRGREGGHQRRRGARHCQERGNPYDNGESHEYAQGKKGGRERKRNHEARSLAIVKGEKRQSPSLGERKKKKRVLVWQ